MKSLVIILALVGSFSAQAAEIVYEYSCVEKNEGLWSFDDKNLTLREEYGHSSPLESATIKGAEVDLLASKSISFYDARNARVVSVDIKKVSDVVQTDRHNEKGGYGTSYVTHQFTLDGSLVIDRINVQDLSFSCTQTRYSIDN